MLYKLVNGELSEAPEIFRGIINYNRDLLEMQKDGWKPLIETGNGESFEYIDHNDHIEKRYYTKPFDYRQARREAYPEIGDMIDAICKAYDGEPDELMELIAKRKLIKQTIKKPEND